MVSFIAGWKRLRSKSAKLLIISITLIVMMSCLSACGGDKKGLPDGRYVPVDNTTAISVAQAIVIDGDDFTIVHPGGILATTVKYTYEEGTITFSDVSASISAACRYEDGSLWFSECEFELEEE